MTPSPRIILTRRQGRNEPWAAVLQHAGLDCLCLPLIRCEPLQPAAELAADLRAGVFDWILFTSPQAAEAFLAAGMAADAGTGRSKVGTLGDGTGASLKSLGLGVDFCAHSQDGADFARAFCTRHPGPGSVLLPGAQRRMGQPAAILQEAGYAVREAALYRTRAVPPEALPADPFGPRDLVFFCSPSAVGAFVAAWSARPRCVAIGETTAAPARAAGFPTVVAASPDLAAMIRAAGLDAAAIAAELKDADPDDADLETANQENAKQENES